MFNQNVIDFFLVMYTGLPIVQKFSSQQASSASGFSGMLKKPPEGYSGLAQSRPKLAQSPGVGN